MTRGERLHNPGNIRHSDTVWAGQSPTQTDPDFVQFVADIYGIRAIGKILMSYQRVGINTIQGAIDRWAPPSENETAAYVGDVCERCGIGPDDEVQLDSILMPLAKAIIVHENGECIYSDDTLQTGIALARGAAK